MIKQLYILSPGGQCTFHLDFCDVQILTPQDQATHDPQLISGFFAAIMSFAQVTTGEADAIKHIPLNNKHFFFHQSPSYTYIIETDDMNKNAQNDDYFELLHSIEIDFLNFLQIYPDINANGCYEIISNNGLTNKVKEKIARFSRQLLFRKYSASSLTVTN